MQGRQGQDWGYLVSMDRLDERYDKVKVPESPGKGQFTRKEGQGGGSARVGDQCLSDLGKWTHYLPSVEGDPPRKYPDLQTQKGILSEKSDHGKNQQLDG